MRKATVTSGGRTGGRTRPPAPQEDGPDFIATQIKKCAHLNPFVESARPMLARVTRVTDCKKHALRIYQLVLMFTTHAPPPSVLDAVGTSGQSC